MRPNGYVLYEGPSRLDGRPVVAVVTGFHRSKNGKTGNMLQTWILRQDVDPCTARQQGQDRSVCGNCPNRAKVQGGSGACYVTVCQAPLSVWRTYRRGGYQRLPVYELFRGHKVRLGAYGDPAAIPLGIWRAIVLNCAGHTGYTHQSHRFPALRRYFMASVESVDRARAMQARGWRTFRTAPLGGLPAAWELVCPASAEAGHRTTCDRCLSCNGAGARPSMVIRLHGSHVPRLAKD